MRHLPKYLKMLLMDYSLTKSSHQSAASTCCAWYQVCQGIAVTSTFQHSWWSCRRQNWNSDVQIRHC